MFVTRILDYFIKYKSNHKVLCKSYFFIYATKYCYQYFDGLLWSIKFVGFAVGILTYAGMTYYFMGEGINIKTLVCLILAIFIIGIQVFW